MLDAGAKESSAIALGRYPVKDSAVGTQQVEDASGRTFRSGLVSDSALRVEQGRSSPVFFEPKTPEKEEESALVTSYEIPRASAIPAPKKSAEDSSTGGEQTETVLSQPNKNERRIVVTSKGSLPITQRQQKRVNQAQKSETSQERPRTYHSRTFPQASEDAPVPAHVATTVQAEGDVSSNSHICCRLRIKTGEHGTVDTGSYDSPSYQSTTPVQSDQTNHGSGYSTDTQQDAYNQGYGPHDTRSVTVGASTQVSGYNQGTTSQKNAQGQKDQYEYHRGTAYTAPQRPLADLLANHQKLPLMQQLHFLGAAGPNQPLRVPIIETTSPLLGGGPQGGPQLQNLRQEIQRQLQQLNQPHQQPFLFGQPHDAIQQMLKSQHLYVQQNQGVQKVITQGPVPIELRVEPLFDASQHGHQGGPNDIPFEVNMLVDAAKKAIMSAGGFPKPEVIVVDGSQGGQMPENVLRAVQQILNSEHAARHEHSRQPKGSASHHSQQKSHAEQPFPPPANVKLNDKLNIQVAGLLVDSHSLQSVFPKNLIHGTGSSKLRYNEPVNVHIPVGDLPPRPAVDVRIRGPDGRVSQVLVPLHDANKLAALAKGSNGGNNFAGSSFPASLFQGVQHFGGGGGGTHQGPKEGLLVGGSTQQPALGIGPVRLGEKVSLIDGAGGTLQIADLPQFDPTALTAEATDLIQISHL
ncbi:hypothetical protein MRX96_020179 [Rhipicephalus microplus]